MAKSKGINIPIKLDTRASQKALAELTKAINKSMGKLVASNKKVAQSSRETTKQLKAETTQIRQQTTSLKKNSSAWKNLNRQTKKMVITNKKLKKSTKQVGGSMLSLKNLVRGGVWGAMLLTTFKVGKAMIGASREMETLEVQFKTLLGSTQKAKERMKELADFTAKTPFKLPEVAKASRVLQTLTKGALATGEGLRLVGDASASTGADFENLAVWVGRAYDGLQSNRPVGEAMMRMQELGLISGDTRNEIEKLQKAGKGKEAWNVLQSELRKTEGGMADLSLTTAGLESTTSDLTDEMLRNVDSSIGLSVAYKGLLSWGNKILNNVNENLNAQLKLNEAMEVMGKGDILKELARRSRVQVRISMAEAQGIKATKVQLNLKAKLTERINDLAKKHGMDSDELQTRANKSMLRVWKTTKNVNSENEFAVQLANQKIKVFEKQLGLSKKLEEDKPKKEKDKDKDKKQKAKEKAEADAIIVAKFDIDKQAWQNEVNDAMRSLKSPDGQSKRDEWVVKNNETKMGLENEARLIHANAKKKSLIAKELEDIRTQEKFDKTGFLLADAESESNRRLEILEEQFKRDMALREKHGKSTLALEKRFQQKKKVMVNSLAMFEVKTMANAGEQILGDMQTIFGETKALAIAQAGVKGIQAGVNSFEFGTRIGGPVLGGIMAGISATATGVQIAKIGSQNFATGGLPTGQNANVTMNERGQEAILNASATARLGRDNIDKINRGQDFTNGGGNTQPSEMKITYNPTINITGSSDSASLLSILNDDKEKFGEIISDAYRRGFVNV